MPSPAPIAILTLDKEAGDKWGNEWYPGRSETVPPEDWHSIEGRIFSGAVILRDAYRKVPLEVLDIIHRSIIMHLGLNGASPFPFPVIRETAGPISNFESPEHGLR